MRSAEVTQRETDRWFNTDTRPNIKGQRGEEKRLTVGSTQTVVGVGVVVGLS